MLLRVLPAGNLSLLKAVPFPNLCGGKDYQTLTLLWWNLQSRNLQKILFLLKIITDMKKLMVSEETQHLETVPALCLDDIHYPINSFV